MATVGQLSSHSERWHYFSEDLLPVGTVSANLFVVFKSRKFYLLWSSVFATPVWIVTDNNDNKTSVGTVAPSPLLKTLLHLLSLSVDLKNLKYGKTTVVVEELLRLRQKTEYNLQDQTWVWKGYPCIGWQGKAWTYTQPCCCSPSSLCSSLLSFCLAFSSSWPFSRKTTANHSLFLLFEKMIITQQ